MLIFCSACSYSVAQNGSTSKPDSISNNQVFTIVQQMPEFQGDLDKYLSEHMNYPDSAIKAGITGTVYINFIVEKDGSVSHVKVIKSIPHGYSLDKEAVKVITAMPKWSIGMQNGHPVRVSYNIPMRFVLNSNSNYLPDNQPQPVEQEGFTNKNEAKNVMKDALKEGKWIEYRNYDFGPTTDTTAPYYILTVYNNDKPVSTSYEYYKSGKLYGEIPRTNGRINGKVKIYYESGKAWSEYPYTNGVENGMSKVYYESGKLKWQSPYVNDSLNGIDSEYYENGKLKSVILFVKDNKSGIMKSYYENGVLKSESPYLKDSLTGIEKEYYENGKLRCEWPYTTNIIEGIAKQYYETGELRIETPYMHGEKNGMQKEYYQDGKIKNTTLYARDREGKTKYYAENGSEIK